MLTVIILSIAGVMCATLIKKNRPEISYCINLLLCMVIAIYVAGNIKEYLTELQTWKKALEGYEQYLQVLFKIIGISYLCEISSDICKDAGYQAIAGQIIILGKCIMLLVGIPIIQNLLTMVERFW